MKRLIFLWIGLCLWQTTFAQEQKYWIFFKDKTTTNYDYKKHLSPQTIENRIRLGLPLTQWTDIPLQSSYLQTVQTQGADLVIQSKWLNGVSASLSQEEVEAIRKNSFVTSVELISPRIKILKTNYLAPKEQNYGTALEQIGAEVFAAAKLDGKGVVIGVIDAGFYDANTSDDLQHVFKNEAVLGIKDFLNPARREYYQSKESNDDFHGTMVLEHITGKNEKRQLGLATAASFYLARSEHGDKEFRGEEDYWIGAVEWMDSLGVRLINTSLGYTNAFDDAKDNYTPENMDGKTAHISKAAHIAAQDKGVFLVVSAGNEGNQGNWQIVAAPADVKDVLSVAANDGIGRKMGYSSKGPEFLEYLKPNISSFSFFGTSFSAPIVTGFVACLMQKAPAMLPKDLFVVIEKSGHLYPYGNNYLGYGVPSAAKALELLDNKKTTKTQAIIAVEGEAFELKIKKKDLVEKQNLVIFHKKDTKNVLSQNRKQEAKGKYSIKRPNNKTKFTTLVYGQHVWELEWK